MGNGGLQCKLHLAARPEPTDPGEAKTFVANSALCRTVLSGATPSLADEIMSGSVVEQFDGKGLEQSADLRLLRRFSNMLLQFATASVFNSFPAAVVQRFDQSSSDDIRAEITQTSHAV